MQLLLYLGSIRNPVLYTYFTVTLYFYGVANDVDVDGDHIELGVKHELELEVKHELRFVLTFTHHQASNPRLCFESR